MQVKGLRKYESEVYAGGRTMMKGLASAGRLPFNLNEVAETWRTGIDGKHIKFKYVRLQVKLALKLAIPLFIVQVLSEHWPEPILNSLNLKPWPDSNN